MRLCYAFTGPDTLSRPCEADAGQLFVWRLVCCEDSGCPGLQPNLRSTWRRWLTDQAGQTLVVILSGVLLFRSDIAEAFDGVSAASRGG